MSLHILLIYLYYPCAYPYVLAPTFNWIMQTLVHIHPKFAPIYLHFRPCRTLICMLYACYADFRALYSGWFTPPYFLCLFKQTGKGPRHTPQMTDTHFITAIRPGSARYSKRGPWPTADQKPLRGANHISRGEKAKQWYIKLVAKLLNIWTI